VNKSTLNKQRDFQRRVISGAGLDPLPYESFITLWWRNPTNHDSLRLTHIGLKFFTHQLKLPSHEIKLSEPIKSKNLLQLERLFKEPYFIKTESLIVMGEEDAIMLQLHAGNLGQYLKNLEMSMD
jgi:hypothetical protein